VFSVGQTLLTSNFGVDVTGLASRGKEIQIVLLPLPQKTWQTKLYTSRSPLPVACVPRHLSA